MAGVCGWIAADGTDLERDLANRMGDGMARHDGSKVQVLVGNRSAVVVAAPGGRGDICEHEGWYCALQGHYYWTDAELKALSHKDGAARTLIIGFERYGADVLNHLGGTFSLALVNEKRELAFTATDRVGVAPVNYVTSSDCLAFASDPKVLFMCPRLDRRINNQAIFNYLYFHAVPSPNGVFEGQQRVLPGGFAWWIDGELTEGAYWQAKYEEAGSQRSFQDLKGAFRGILDRSVETFTGEDKLGCFLSGGTDSSTVAGVLCRVQDEPAATYSIGFDAEGYDEMEYARLASNHFGTVHHEYYVTPENVVTAIPMIADAYAEPFGNSSAVPSYYCARMAREDGVTRLLAGDGGDELFAGNLRYAKQHVFAVWDRLPAPLRAMLEPLSRTGVFANGPSLLRKAGSYVAQASVSMPGRLETYNLLERLGVDNILERDFREQVDTGAPLKLLTGHYERVQAKTLLNKMLGLDLKFTLTDNDLPKVSKMCELAGVGVGYPLLSDELQAFAEKLDPSLKLKGNYLRYFFKESLKDFLPQEIITKSKHGFGLPFGRWLVEHKGLSELANDNLSALKTRNIVRADFIDQLIGSHLKEHAHYYGTMAWILIMLEQWYQHHVDAA